MTEELPEGVTSVEDMIAEHERDPVMGRTSAQGAYQTRADPARDAPGSGTLRAHDARRRDAKVSKKH